jgi:[acyl-carrier-protein] S-malonyltransferase
MRVLAIVAPGQGAQTPGYLAPWLESPDSATLLATYSAAAGLDLAHAGTVASAEDIRDTAVAQPLLVASALLSARALLGTGAELPSDLVLAGHSVGEVAVAALAGVFGDEDAMRFVGVRGRAMAAAAVDAGDTGMTAVVGGDRDEVLQAIKTAGLTAANDNGPGQVVAAGTAEQLAALAAAPPAKARLVPLSVAGAFHTVHMQPAVAELAAFASTLQPGRPTTRLISNADGAEPASGAEALDRMVVQVSSPVRWDRCLETLREAGVNGLLELAPAGTLVGMARRGLPGVATFKLSEPDQLDDARGFVTEHTS